MVFCHPIGTFSPLIFFFFFNDTATTEIYTLSLHDALPIYAPGDTYFGPVQAPVIPFSWNHGRLNRSEEHTSELQSLTNLVCRLLLETKNAYKMIRLHHKDQQRPRCID